MKRPAIGQILGYAALTVILTAGAAQSIAGSDTVTGYDIVEENITTPDGLGPRYYEWTWHHAAGAPLDAEMSIGSIAGPAIVVPVSGRVTNHTGIRAACPDRFAANGFFDVPNDPDDILFGSVLSGEDFRGRPWGLTHFRGKSAVRRTLAAGEFLRVSLATVCYVSLWPVPAASLPAFDVTFVLAVYPTE